MSSRTSRATPSPKERASSVDDVSPIFTLAFKESLTFKDYKPPPMEWKQAVTGISTRHHRFKCWVITGGFCGSFPLHVPYSLSAHDALPKGIVKDRNATLQSYNSELICTMAGSSSSQYGSRETPAVTRLRLSIRRFRKSTARISVSVATLPSKKDFNSNPMSSAAFSFG